MIYFREAEEMNMARKGQAKKILQETFKARGENVLEKVKELLREVNVRRIIIKMARY